MIAADTSTWIAYLQGAADGDVALLGRALADQQVLMAPVVLSELFSDSAVSTEVATLLLQVPLIEPEPDYRRRAGELRASTLEQRRKARLGHALIAQICVDRDIGLLTRDRDFSAIETAAGVRIVVAS